VAGGGRKFHDEELHNFYPLENTGGIRIMNERK
jgi:hypothetical protein